MGAAVQTPQALPGAGRKVFFGPVQEHSGCRFNGAPRVIECAASAAPPICPLCHSVLSVVRGGRTVVSESGGYPTRCGGIKPCFTHHTGAGFGGRCGWGFSAPVEGAEVARIGQKPPGERGCVPVSVGRCFAGCVPYPAPSVRSVF